MKFQLINTTSESETQKKQLLDLFYSRFNNKNVILQQFYLFQRALLENSPQKCIAQLHEALACTLKNFDFKQVCNYRLTWNELSILNNIANQYRNSNTPHLGSEIFQKVLDYSSFTKPDISFSQTFLPLSIYMFGRSLYSQNRFHELCLLLTHSTMIFFKCNIRIYLLFLFYYSQSLAECSDNTNAIKYAQYTCALNNLFELSTNSNVLIDTFANDYKIIL